VQSRSRATIGFLVLLVLASAALRLGILLARPLWFDELFTFWAARLPLRALLDALRLDSGPPGFYLLEKPFALAADRLGHGDWLIRVPSFFAVLAMLGAARTQPAGIARACFVALLSGSTLLNLYAAEARPYGVLALLALALFLLSLRGAESARRVAAVAFVAALALYAHYLAAFVLAALLVLSARARRWRSCLALAAGGVAFLPWAPVLGHQPDAAVAWIREPFAASAAGVLSALGGVGRVPRPFGAAPSAWIFFAGTAAGAACFVLLLAAARRERDAAESAAFAVMVLGGVFAAGIWKPIFFAGRTETAVLPVWIWGLASAARGRRALRWACAAAAALGLAATASVALRRGLPTAPAAVIESLERVATRDDVVLAAASFYLPARLASERGELAASVRPLPPELADHPGWFLPAVPGPAEDALLADTLAALPRGGRLFLVVPPPYQTAAFDRALGVSGQTRALVRSRDAFVTLWTPGPPSAPAPR
jgi:hypothetical protein